MNNELETQFIYIIKETQLGNTCKIGVTNDIDRRLKEYNSYPGKSITNLYQCLFSAKVKDMFQLERDIKEEFSMLREKKNKEVYFYNDALFDKYVNFIKNHPLFLEETFIKVDISKDVIKIKYVKKNTPTLYERELTRKDVMQKAKKIADDEFYTRYEDIEKEINMYEKSI